jgi:hypothetical protein
MTTETILKLLLTLYFVHLAILSVVTGWLVQRVDNLEKRK